MKKKLKLGDSLTREIVGDLFFHPPVNDAELSERVGSVDVTTARRLVIDRLDQGMLPTQAGPLFLAILGKLGIGRQKQRLMRIALDLSRESRDRLWAAIVLTSNDPKVMEQLVGKLGPDGVTYLAELSLFELLSMQDEKDIGPSVATALEDELDERSLIALVCKIESCRSSIGASCAVAYGDALAKDNLVPIRKKILEFFVQEGSDSGIELLEQLRDRASNGQAQRDYQAALLRLRSQRIDPDRRIETPRGYALVSNCDGQGGFFVLGAFENTDATYNVADLFLHAGGIICDGTVYPRRSMVEVDDLKKNMERELGCFFIEVTLPEAAKLIAINKTYMDEQKQMVSEDTTRAVALFERVEGAFRWGEGSCCPPIASVCSDEVCKLLERPEYEDTWFFEAGDFDEACNRPATADGGEAWVRASVANLVENTVRFRLIAMAEHMGRFHFWRGETREAALCRAMAGSLRQDFFQSPLVHAMLLRSTDVFLEKGKGLVYGFGDPADRQYYKGLFFQTLTRPTGLDLARLDLTAAAASALDAAFELLPVEQRPWESERDAASFAIGKVFADHLIKGGLPRPEQIMTEMSKALASASRLSDSRRHEVLMTVVPSLYAFAEEVCSQCPVKCLSQPDADMSDVFFTPDHPLFQGKRD
jgi:hypothetical protein